MMPMALCQIVAHEVQLENIRRRDKVTVCYCPTKITDTELLWPMPCVTCFNHMPVTALLL